MNETADRTRKAIVSEDSGEAANDLQTVDGELLEDPNAEASNLEPEARSPKTEITIARQKTSAAASAQNQKSYLLHVFVPLVFLVAALFGGMRIAAADSAFIFIKPPLVCLIFAAILVVLFVRAGLIRLDGWFSEDFSTLKNIANGAVLIALFAASVQIFNSLLPERGLPFWVFAFCFFWTLLNNLFSVFDARKLLRSLGALFGFAFLVKYLALASVTAQSDAGWWQRIAENPAQELFAWALDLPRFSGATGYIQFFAVVFYLLGLFLLPASTKNEK